MSIAFSIPNIPSFSSLTPNKGQILFVPDIKYLVKFANGDLGISDAIKKSMIMRNLSQVKSVEQFNIFANASGAQLKNAPNSYLKNGKLVVPIQDLTLDPSKDTSGLKALEKSLIQSIFESQKPYMDIAKLVSENFVRIEDIIARVLAVGVSSKKPKGNPKALGYQPGGKIPINTALSKLGSIKDQKPKGSSLSPSLDGLPTDGTKNPNTSDVNSTNGTKGYEIISTVYSTGLFDPTIKYDYEYVDIKDDSLLESDLSDIGVDIPDNDSGDPYQGQRPNGVVFGIFNSKGQPLETIPDWLVKSGKWFGQFDRVSSLSYVWIKPLSNSFIGSAPPDNKGGWTMTKVKRQFGDKIVEQPLVVSDNKLQEYKNYYTNYYREYTIDSLAKKPLTQAQKDTALKEVLTRLDVQSLIENLSTYSYLSSIQLKDGQTFPMDRSAFKVKKVVLPNSSPWIDPESEYDMKIIKVDSTKNIKFLEVVGQPELSTQIIRFIKKTVSVILSDGSRFSGSLKTGTLTPTTSNFENAPEFVLDNPEDTKYRLTIKLSSPPLSLKNGTSWILSNGNLAEISRDDTKYKYTEKGFISNNWTTGKSGSIDIPNSPGGITKIDYSVGVVTKFYTGLTASSTIPTSWNDPKFDFNWGVDISKTEKTIYDVSFSDKKIIFKSKTSTLTTISSNPDTVKLPSGLTLELKNSFVTSWNVFHEKDISSYIPENSLIKNTVIIDINDFDNIIVNTITIPPNEIRVKEDNNPFGKMIDNKQVTNDQLAVSSLYSKGTYGSSTDGSTQEIEQIYRFMKSESDIETYYIIEGVLSSNNKQDFPVDGVSNPNAKASSSGGGYYRLPHFLGAIKVFIDMVIDVFTKTIPSIQTLLDLISNPASFLVNSVILKKLGDNNKSENVKFEFLSTDFFRQFSKLEGMSPSTRKKFVNSTQLRNYVFVNDIGDYKFLLDGSAVTKFLGITFGIGLTKLVPSLIFNKDITDSNKSLKSFLNLSPDDKNKQAKNSSVSNPSLLSRSDSSNQIKTQSNGKEYNEEISIQYSTGKFIEGVDYEYIYVSQYISGLLKEASDLENVDTDKSILKYEEILSKDPNNNFVKDKLTELKSVGNSTQPLLDFMLNMTTFPLKVIKGIIEYIMNFFKSLTSPFTLVGAVLDFVSFKWMLDFFTPSKLLEIIGIKFDISLFNSWISNVDSYPKDFKFDLSKIIDLPFMPKLFSVTPDQLKVLSKSPISMLSSILCLIESIINGFIDFIWAIFGLESILKPPHIKLCKDTNADMSLKDMLDVLNGNYIDALSSGLVSSDVVGEDNDNTKVKGEYNFIYEIKLPDGRNFRDLNREELQKFIDDNKDIQYDFKF